MTGSPFKALLDLEKSQDKQVDLEMTSVSGRYRIGPPVRPYIKHDNGFLDAYGPEAPTAQDRKNYAIWLAKGAIAQSLCRKDRLQYDVLDKCGHEDQTEAADAYMHYMKGNGRSRSIDYGKFLESDPSGQAARRLLLEDAKKHIEKIGRYRTQFSVTSEPYHIGGKDAVFPDPPLSYQYPQTINWQRAIGGHVVWISADVQIDVDNSGHECRLRYSADLTMHMEDMYNFNPKMKDVSTGIPDSENGRFQIVGLAHQYLTTGTYRTRIVW